MDLLVSVIIPVYNKEKYIRSCVESVLAQTYTNLEIILVNDGSKDNSEAICKEIASNSTKVVLINQENRGVSAARNTGMSYAKGEYLAFVDADDALHPHGIKALVETAQKHDAHMAIGRYMENEELPVGVYSGEDFLCKALEDNPMTYTVWRVLYKRDFVKNLSFPEGYISHEDSYFNFLCALRMPKVATTDTVVYNYNTANESLSRSTFTTKKYNDICGLLAKKEDIIRSEHKDLLPLFNHLKTKIQMALLQNLMLAKGKEFRQKEKETLSRFNVVKEYFQPNLICSNASFYSIVARNMYRPYKLRSRFRSFVKKLIKR